MQENFEVKGLAPDLGHFSDECLIARKVYGRCRQQDCLRPFDSTVITPPPGAIEIGSSRLGQPTPITIGGVTTNPNQIISFPVANGTQVQLVPGTFKISDISHTVTPSAFSQEGFFDLSITYTFAYDLRVTYPGVPTPTITTFTAFTTYTKLLSLFGGESSTQRIAIADSLLNPPDLYANTANLPGVLIEAIANPLQQPVLGIYPGTTPGTLANQIDLTIGLFTIIKLYRIVNLTVSSCGGCDIPECEPITGDPCEFFNSLPFPFEDFDPPAGQ